MSNLSELMPYRGAVTERLLLREFSHRVKDELASAIGLVAAAASRCDSSEARASLAAALDMLQDHAHIQHSLQAPEYDTTIDLAAYLHPLCRAISRTRLAADGTELLLSVYPLRMSSESCWLLGMIVFELIADAAGHTFQNGSGSVRLEISPAGGAIECRITDNGRQVGDPSQVREIIEALAGRLRGTVRSQSGPNGTSTTVSFPYGR